MNNITIYFQSTTLFSQCNFLRFMLYGNDIGVGIDTALSYCTGAYGSPLYGFTTI